MKFIIGFLLMVAAFIASPALSILVINYAFGTNIPLTLWTWFLMLLVFIVVGFVTGFISGFGKSIIRLR